MTAARRWQNQATVRRRLALLLPLALLAFGSADAQGPARTPGAAAVAWAVKISVPGGAGAATPVATSPPAGAPATGGEFSYPADGSVVSASSTTASATTSVQLHASATAESDITGLSLFKGELTADAVTARASAGTGYADAGGNQNGSTALNLKVEGQPLVGTKATLGTWGQLTVGATGVDRSAPSGAQGYRGFVTELDLHLTADHGGLPAGSEIQIGYAEAAAQTAPPTTTSTTTVPRPTVTTAPPTVEPGAAPAAKRKHAGKHGRRPLRAHPRLVAGPYVFPVYGPVSFIDTYGAPRSDVSYHHGDDIFGQLGQPVVACADATVFSVGWNKIGGLRLWLLDDQGNQYYYAHLSAYSTAAVNGARVKAGQVIGFMGNTGDAEGTPYHLHFEVHPVRYLYLGYDGAVDPTTYLDRWSHLRALPYPLTPGWAPAIPGGPAAPLPGAILLGESDISSADGLDPGSLERALRPPKTTALPLTSIPALIVPTHDLGRG